MDTRLPSNNALQYWQGWGAYNAGALHTSNPYSSNSEHQNYQLWYSGWQDAALEAETP